MTTSSTARLDLPFIQSGQALKNITHNEALQRVDAGIYLSCLNMAADDLPAEPLEGQAYIISQTPDISLQARKGNIGVYQSGGWVWFIPTAGWTIWDATEQILRVFDGAVWRKASPDSEVTTQPFLGLNATASEQQRLALASDSSLFTHDGHSHRLTVNRASDADTASLIFQTDYQGRVELGLTGHGGFALKTSSDGTVFTTKLSAPENYAGVRSPAFGSVRVTIESDAAVFLKTPATGGVFIMTVVSDTASPQVGHSGMFAYDTGTTPAMVSLAKTVRIENHRSLILDGTQSTVGRLGISAVEGGIYIENRLVNSQDISLTFLC